MVTIILSGLFQGCPGAAATPSPTHPQPALNTGQLSLISSTVTLSWPVLDLGEISDGFHWACMKLRLIGHRVYMQCTDLALDQVLCWDERTHAQTVAMNERMHKLRGDERTHAKLGGKEQMHAQTAGELTRAQTTWGRTNTCKTRWEGTNACTNC